MARRLIEERLPSPCPRIAGGKGCARCVDFDTPGDFNRSRVTAAMLAKNGHKMGRENVAPPALRGTRDGLGWGGWGHIHAMAAMIILAALMLPGSFALAASAVDPADSSINDDGLFGGFSLERMAKLLEAAGPMRLAREREAVAEEIGEGILFDAEKVTVAIRALHAKPADTAADNVMRITAAFATVDPRLVEPMALAAAGEYAKAAAAAKGVVNPDGVSYHDAAKRMLHADSLFAAGRGKKAAEAYVEIVRAMPQRVSFAATAALRAGRTYEKLGRRVYAMQLYQWWIDNYSFLDHSGAEALAVKVAEIRAEYDSPLLTMAEKMNAVAGRLGDADSGAATQSQEREILAMLNDLIAMMEDQGGGGGGGGGDGGEGECSGSGSGGGAASGTGSPSGPAEQSTLPGGEAVQPTGLSRARTGDDNDAWGALPPRQREQLVEMFKQKYPERYTEMLEAYYRRLSETK